MTNWDPRAPKAGERAPDLELLDEAGRLVHLSDVARRKPLLVLIFAGIDDPEGAQLLRDYRDVTLAMKKAGVTICAIGPADPAAARYMRSQRGLGFPVLSDPECTALSQWGMRERTALFLLDRGLIVKQRAFGNRAPADALMTFVKRGGARAKGNRLERLSGFFHALQHALRPARG